MTLKQMRKARGYSQEHVAEQLEVRQAYYSKIERGLANLTLDKTIELARILDHGVGEVAEALAGTRLEVLATLAGPSGNGDSPGYLNARGIVCRLARFAPSPIGSPVAA